MKLKVFTTRRQIRNWLEDKDNRFLDKYMSIGEFFDKIVVVDGVKFIDKDLRKKYLFEAIKNVDVEKLGISKEFLAFFEDSDFIFDFFNELFLERVDINEVRMNDIYLDFDEHLAILEEIYKNYKEILAKNGYIDRFLIEDFRINKGLLEGIDEIELRLDGYLSKFDIEVLSKIDLPIKIYFEADEFNKNLIEKSLQISVKDGKFEFDFHNKKLIRRDFNYKNPEIEVEHFSDRMGEIGFIFAKIKEFVESGIKPENIVVILPDENFSEIIKLFDEKENLNFAMGESFSNAPIYIKLKSIYEYLTGDEKALKKCEDVIEEFDKSDVIEFIRNNASEKELKVVDEELFKLEAFKEMFKDKREFLYFVLERLKELSFDDVYSGKITCMGVLESRGMEFEGVIMIDFNDEFVPRVKDSDMFLNTFIRKNAKLPTRFDKENLQKHYYYQLINKAKKVAISYVKNDDMSESRFLYELGFEGKEAKKYNFFKENSFDLTVYDEEFEVKYPIYPTTLKTLLECPKKYYFSYVLEIESKKDEEFFGNLFHKAVEESIKQKDKISTSGAYYNKIIQEMVSRISDKKLLFEVLAKWSDKIKAFCEKDFDEMKTAFNLVEKRFEVEFEGVLLKAKVDRVDVFDKKVVFIDYKTSKESKKNEEYINDFQTTFYYLLAKKHFPNKEIEIVIWDIKETKKEKGVIKLKELKEVLNSLPKKVKEASDIVYEVDGKEKIKKASEICRFCDYKVACGRDE
ncbi:MAG: PD-(D/E)XK nuclease family protein [Nautiliaceae bacterium]